MTILVCPNLLFTPHFERFLKYTQTCGRSTVKRFFHWHYFFHSRKSTEQKQISYTEIYSYGKCWYLFSIRNHSVHLAQFFNDYYPGTFMSLGKSPLLLFYSIGGVSREKSSFTFLSHSFKRARWPLFSFKRRSLYKSTCIIGKCPKDHLYI